MTTLTIAAIGVPWYSREGYPRILEIMEDAGTLPPSYDEWLGRTEDVVQQCREKGLAVIHADIEPRFFLAWCQQRRRQADALARRDFANSVALVSISRNAGSA